MRPRTTYLIDTENVHNTWTELLDETRQTDSFILFYTVNHQPLSLAALAKICNKRRKVECVPADTGFNALDVTLVAELGRRVELDRARTPNVPRAYIIISDDKGYDPAVQHLCRQGVQVSRTAMHVTDRHRKPAAAQPASTPSAPARSSEADDGDEPSGPTGPAARPRYKGTYEQWRQILLSYPDVTESDVTVCMKYLPSSMSLLDVHQRLTTFHNHLVKYYKNLSLTADMYDRVKPAIRHIAEHGPLVGKAKKTAKK